MSVEASYNLYLRIVETLALGEDLAANPSQVVTPGDIKGTLTASTTVPATEGWPDTRSLAAGADSIDLTALARGTLPTIDLTGLKVQLVIIRAAAANTAGILFKQGASNPYLLFGAASDQHTLLPGTAYYMYWADKLADVAAGAKEVDMTSTDLDAIYSMILVAG